ncbi:alpha/beta fold hydrolase [Candidatus Uhrbacteria bacterium]|nr:alpha/beta fold hydrolase [Candidatus Uhrbacteria bacterium]
MFQQLKRSRDVPWDEVFEVWRASEGSDPVWQELAKKKGWDSWEAWRGNQVAIFGADKRRWTLYEITEPNVIIPAMRIGPFKGWQEHFQEKNRHTFEDLVREQTSWVASNVGVRARLASFPPRTQFIGLFVKQDQTIVLFEGHHRAAAIALAVAQGQPIVFDALPTIALTEYEGDIQPILDQMLNPVSFMEEHITLTTTDQVSIAAVYRQASEQKIAILLHMMPATKESWEGFAQHLGDAGYASLAIDERGHGESTMGGTLDYQKFTDVQQQAKRLDVEAAIDYAHTHGFSDAQIVMIGASIGANLAIQALGDHPEIPVAVALSPGLDFRGIQTEPLIKALKKTRHVLLVASDDDTYSFETVSRLHALNPTQTILIERSGIGHGTAMTDRDPKLIGELVAKMKFDTFKADF